MTTTDTAARRPGLALDGPHAWPRAEVRLDTPARPVGALLALALFALYALTSAGALVSYDGGVMYDTATRIVDAHTLALPPHHHGMPGVNGGFYSKYGIAQSLAEVPLYALGQALAPHIAAPLGHKIVIALTLLTNPAITALAALLFYLLARALGAGMRGAVVAALLIGVATPYWPYAKTDFSEPLSTLALTGAVLFLVRARTRPAPGPYVISGLFIALGILTKLTILFALPALGLYALYVAASTGAGAGTLRRLLAWGTPIAAGLVAAALYNLARYGSLTDTGYRAGDDLPFHAPLLHGLRGLLVSPGKGLLWFCPLVFLALTLWPLLLRRRPAEGLLSIGIIAPTLVVYGTYPVWWGGHGWGPRYLLPLLPLILLPLVYAPDVLARRPFVRACAATLAALSALVQVLGVSIQYERFLATGFSGATEQLGLWVAHDSPLFAHAWLLAYDLARVFDPRVAAGMIVSYPWRHPSGTSLSQRIAIDGWDYWWWQVLGRYGMSAAAQLTIVAVLLAILLVAAALLWRAVRRHEARTLHASDQGW